ncbi:hypothetical protein DSECCO2_417510 [anaerobic digester metagenome]
MISARTKATPPSMFIHRARVAFLTAISVSSCLMSMKEQNVVTSQKKYSHSRLLEKTSPFMAPRNRTMKKKKRPCLDVASFRWCSCSFM